MDIKQRAQRLCFLLSWQEALSRTPHSEPFAGRAYRKRANKAVARLREEARTDIANAGEELQARVARGDSGESVDALRHRIQQLNHLLKAQTASDLGGHAAMTLEDYAIAFPEDSPGPMGFTPLDRRDYITIVVSIVVLVVTCLGLAWFHLWRVNIHFTLEPAGPDYLALQLSNEGQQPVAFIGSWSDFQALDGTTYGVAVHCQAVESDVFQPATEIGDIWIYQNEVMAPQRRVSVEPGVTITVLLDLRELEAAYGEPLAAVRLECGTPSNRRRAVFTHTIDPSTPE